MNEHKDTEHMTDDLPVKNLTKFDIVKKEIISWVKVFGFAIVAAYCINSFVLVNAAVPTGSMENAIMPGDRIVASRLSYAFSKNPNRLDVIVFVSPEDNETLFVKRVIGLPGDVVEVIDGKVYINGDSEPLDESYVKGIPYSTNGPFNVPENSYFVMGDNRNNSSDSREWANKYVSRDKILGRVMFGYYPRPKFIR
jgi:signal peptidase I